MREIPEEYIEEIRAVRMTRSPMRGGYKRNALSPAINASSSSTDPGFNGLQPGRRVHHKRFGEGTIINMEGRGEHARVQVNFSDGGAKWLVCAYANLEMV